MTDWFTTWFNDDYLTLYPHRDAADAGRLVQLITRVTGWGPGWRVLDVGCGPARHAAAVQEAGVAYVGLDLSMALLRRARAASAVPLIRADMRRLPVQAGSLHAVLSLFTSFGYFANDAEHEATLAGMARCLARGGWLVLDFLNADQVRASVPRSAVAPVAASGGALVAKHLSSDERYVVKHITLASGARHQERVRLFSRDELITMVRNAGLAPRATFGDYDGGPTAPGAPRTLLLAQAA